MFSLLCLVPPPFVNITVDPAVDPIYSSTAVNLTCTAVLAEEVDTATIPTAAWTSPTGTVSCVFDPQSIDSCRISMIPADIVGERLFESTLVYYPVDHEMDNGLHTCKMNIISNAMSSGEDSLIEDATNSGNANVSVKS